MRDNLTSFTRQMTKGAHYIYRFFSIAQPFPTGSHGVYAPLLLCPGDPQFVANQQGKWEISAMRALGGCRGVVAIMNLKSSRGWLGRGGCLRLKQIVGDKDRRRVRHRHNATVSHIAQEGVL